jgi:hypothetical protein
MEEEKFVFAYCFFDGAFTHAEKLSIRLLALLRCIGALVSPKLTRFSSHPMSPRIQFIP